jgi:hypothetical protein
MIAVMKCSMCVLSLVASESPSSGKMMLRSANVLRTCIYVVVVWLWVRLGYDVTGAAEREQVRGGWELREQVSPLPIKNTGEVSLLQV